MWAVKYAGGGFETWKATRAFAQSIQAQTNNCGEMQTQLKQKKIEGFKDPLKISTTSDKTS